MKSAAGTITALVQGSTTQQHGNRVLSTCSEKNKSLPNETVPLTAAALQLIMNEVFVDHCYL